MRYLVVYDSTTRHDLKQSGDSSVPATLRPEKEGH